MENKNVGYLLIGVSLVLVVIILLFSNTLTSFVDQSCSAEGHGEICPMYETISQQTFLSLGIVALLILVGLVLVFSKVQKEFIIKTKTIHKKNPKKKIDISELKEEEKQVLELIKTDRAIFQADLIEKTQFGKAKISRIID